VLGVKAVVASLSASGIVRWWVSVSKYSRNRARVVGVLRAHNPEVRIEVFASEVIFVRSLSST
jgi:hypothetical protein